jgi:hypothetical protein
MKQIILSLVIILTAFTIVDAQCYYKGKLKKKCCGATSIASCTSDGCGGDKYLNRRKNMVTKPTQSDVEDWDFSKMTHVKFPASWASGTPRTLLKNWGEGTPVRISAFLRKAKNYTSGKEACNCNLKVEENNDFHLVLVERKQQSEKRSITAEITPRIRPEGWTFSKLSSLAKVKTYVRVTGYLMFDSQHAGSSVPARLTHWEIHPVTSFEVCTLTKAECDQGEGWQDLKSFPEP